MNAAIHQVNIGRMRGVIPFMMTRCDEALIPPLWAQLHRYDATKGYEAARDGLLSAFGLSLPSANSEMAAEPGGASQQGRRFDVARLKMLDGQLSLAPWECEFGVILMLRAHGYHHVRRPKTSREVSDVVCNSADGEWIYVWCKLYTPKTLVTGAQVLSAIGTVSSDPSQRAMIITTSGYTRNARSVAKAQPDKISLIDGQQLVTMMQRVQPQ